MALHDHGTATVDITNSGTGSVTGTGTFAVGISARVLDGNGTVTVSGGTVSGTPGIAMSTSGTGTAKVSVSGGTVSATGSNNPVAIFVGSGGSGGAVAEVTGGTVSATVDFSVGISADTSGGSGTATVTVTGGSVTASGPASTGILIHPNTTGGATVTIGANASVSASGSSGNALEFVGLSGGTLSATVLGTLSGTGGANAARLLGSGTLTVGNGGTSGTLIGDVALDTGATLVFNRSDAITYGGVISGHGGSRSPAAR